MSKGLVGESSLLTHMRPRMAKKGARHNIVDLLHRFCLFCIIFGNFIVRFSSSPNMLCANVSQVWAHLVEDVWIV